MAWRWVNRAASLILALVVLATLGGGYLFYRAMPATSGVETLPGLSAEVRVWRDHFGVPHIFAASMDDAARALGYTHASERMFQMEILRRVGQGRMAEIRGAELLGVDKFIRTVGFYREAETSVSALSPWAQKRLEAYADGVNAFLASHPLPPEFLLAGDRPEPWRPADSLVIAKLEAYQLSQSFRLKLQRARLLQKFGPDEANWLFPAAKPGEPITTLPSLGDGHAARESIDGEIGALTGIGHGRVERMGDRRIADGDRKADPRQRSASRSQRADPLVSGPRRHARRVGQGRDDFRAPRSSSSARTIRSPGG